jgi:hypothetical protein
MSEATFGVGPESHKPNARWRATSARPSPAHSAALDGRAHACLDDPRSAVAHPVGEEGGKLSRAVPFRLRLDHLSGR